MRLLERFLEPARQRVVAAFLGFDRLLKERLAARFGRRENAFGIGQLRLVATLWFVMPDDPTQIQVDDQRRMAARALELEFALQFRHAVILVR